MAGAERTSTNAANGDPYTHLVEAAQLGDDVALAELVRRTQPAVWRLCRALGDAADVEDLTQDVFLRAVKSLASYRFEAPFLPWLLTIARRVCADHVRRGERRRRLARRLSGEVRDDLVPADSSDVHALLDQLDPDRKLAFVLTQIVGLSYDEAAEICECPIGTIRSRVARARSVLLDTVRQAQAR
ncbi:MAG: RNA polymerase sigma factor [Acidimicrobiia bacterium]